jgi:conjugal transfer/entry exclusion protein
MEELLKNKLGAAQEFKDITNEILSLSPKAEYEKISSLIERRQQYIEKVNVIDEKINKNQELDDKFTESNEAKRLKSEIRETFKETAKMDNQIRKNLNGELKNLKNILNQPETATNLVNIKV